ncbi:DUF998 domain-containing protein [Streptomyces sulphureus]|uniref:DUF998 domain-containing protein n=1 Tax=Streptomyces sulphureus TaxID=47758 RepID=UPI000368D1A5|nr:DUF998 domain-containing protein [Streptomyces sulphureus]
MSDGSEPRPSAHPCPDPRAAQGPTRLALAAPVAALLLMGALHLHPGYSPLHDVLSSYALSPVTAGFFTAAVLAMAVAVGALGASLGRLLPAARTPLLRAALAVSVAAFAATALFPTDPETPHTATGFIHRYAAGTAFAALAVAGSLLARRLRGTDGWERTGRRLTGWAVVTWWGIAVFAVAHVRVLWPASAAADMLSWFPERGIVQRLLLCAQIALLLAVARPLHAAARTAARPISPGVPQPVVTRVELEGVEAGRPLTPA